MNLNLILAKLSRIILNLSKTRATLNFTSTNRTFLFMSNSSQDCQLCIIVHSEVFTIFENSWVLKYFKDFKNSKKFEVFLKILKF